MSQFEAVVAFLLLTSASLVGYGAYRALRFAEGHLRWLGVLIPSLYLFAWLAVPFLGVEAREHNFNQSDADTPMGFASGVYLTSFVLMTVATFAGMLCIRFFVRPEDRESEHEHEKPSGVRKPGPG